MIRAFALVALLGCGAVNQHPYATAALANTSLVVGAGVCALDCGGGWRGVSEGVLIGELAVSSMAVLVVVEGIITYAQESH